MSRRIGGASHRARPGGAAQRSSTSKTKPHRRGRRPALVGHSTPRATLGRGDPAPSEELVLRFLFSPETSPQLVDSSSQHRSVAFQAAMPPFLGAFFRVAHSLPPRSSSVALSSALNGPLPRFRLRRVRE